MGMSEPMIPEREAVLRHRAANMRCEPENVNLNTLTCKLCKRSWWFGSESKYDLCQVKLRHAPLDLQDALKEIDRLRESEVALIKERDRLRTSIRNQAGDNLCWLDNSGVTKIPEQAEFLESCRRYHSQVSGSVGVLDPQHMTIAQLEAEIERLRAEQRIPPGNLFEVVTTAFVFRDDRVLLTRRAKTKKRFPGLWTVPGGHLERADFEKLTKDGEYWYDVLEIALRREVREEVSLEITDIQHVENLATIHHDGAVLVLSCSASWASGEVTLDPTEADEFAWVSREESKNYDLISGLPEEIERAFERRLRKQEPGTAKQTPTECATSPEATQAGDPGWTPEQRGDIADLTVEFLDLKSPGKPKQQERSIPGLPEGFRIARIRKRSRVCGNESQSPFRPLLLIYFEAELEPIAPQGETK